MSPFRRILLASSALLLGASLAAQRAPGIRVAVFRGLGADPECLSDAVEALKLDPAIRPEVLDAAELALGGLDRFDALVLPGGSGSRQMGNLGDLGQRKVLDFVQARGGGVVGICAGAYMLSDTPAYPCLHLGGLEAIDREHDARGHGLVRFTFTPQTFDVFPEFRGREHAFMQYFEGPVLVPAPGGKAVPLGVMASDVHLENGAPAGMTPGRSFLAWAEAGRGRVFLVSGHPENTPGMRWMLPRMVRWTLRKPLVSYAPAVVRVERGRAERLFDAPARERERACFEALTGEPAKGDAAQVRGAMAELIEMRSWGAKERLEGCLRHRDATVRVAAAEALVDLEHTAARKSVEAAARLEKDGKARAALTRCARSLAAMTHGR